MLSYFIAFKNGMIVRNLILVKANFDLKISLVSSIHKKAGWFFSTLCQHFKQPDREDWYESEPGEFVIQILNL